MKNKGNKIFNFILCALIFTSFFMVEVPKDVIAQVTEEWAARYDGTGYGNDYACAIDVDSQGNVYVTGASQGNGTGYDYTTIKYDSWGSELWIARFNGPSNGNDYATAMALDPSGNVYITGRSPIGSFYDYVTVAYDSSGNELWMARYNGPGNRSDHAYAIALDSSGNVYITGFSWGGIPFFGGTGFDYATVAYDPCGNELWVARYNGPSNGWDEAHAIAVDSSGNVYVTGWSRGIVTNDNYATVAYNSFGNELWVARYIGPSKATAIAVDCLSGNVYVTGNIGSGTTCNYATIAYDTSGNELWIARYNGYANALTVDSYGNVYVSGWSFDNGTHYDFTTSAYDTSGNKLWAARYNGPGNGDDFAYAIASDSSGNVYVTGSSYSGGPANDYATVAYDSSGNELWVARYNGLDDDYDIARAIAVGPSGNIYVTGESDHDYATIKYSQKPSVLVATIDIDPDTLNLKSKGRWITCYIDLPSYDVNDIDIKTILLEDTTPAEWGDIQGETLMVKFDRSDVEDMLSPGTYNLKVTGELIDGTVFEGYSDEIRVIDPSK